MSEEAAPDGLRLLGRLAHRGGGEERRALHRVFREREIERRRGGGALYLRQRACLARVDDGHFRLGRRGGHRLAQVVVADALVAQLQSLRACVSGEVDDEQRPLSAGPGRGDARLGRGERLVHRRGRRALQQHDAIRSEVAQLTQRAGEPLRVLLREPQPCTPRRAVVVADDDRETRSRPRGTGQRERDEGGEGGESSHGRFSRRSDVCRVPLGRPGRGRPLRRSSGPRTPARTLFIRASYPSGPGLHTA